MPDIISSKAFYIEFDGNSDQSKDLECSFVMRDQREFSKISKTEFASHLSTIRFVYDGLADIAEPQVIVSGPSSVPRPRSTPCCGWVFGAKFQTKIESDALNAPPDRLAPIIQHHQNLMTPGHTLEEFEAEMQLATAQLVELISSDMPGAPCPASTKTESPMSQRTARRRFQAAAGLAPKRHFTLSRFHSALPNVVRKGRSLTGVAYAHDYSDQPHFSREFRKLSGQTPSQFSKLWKTHSVHFVQDSNPGSSIRLAITLD